VDVSAVPAAAFPESCHNGDIEAMTVRRLRVANAALWPGIIGLPPSSRPGICAFGVVEHDPQDAFGDRFFAHWNSDSLYQKKQKGGRTGKQPEGEGSGFRIRGN